MSEQAMPEELGRLTRRLRLPYLRQHAPEVIATAKAQRWDPAEVLRVLLEEEARGRDAATREMRRHQARFPSGKTFQSWREHDSSISLATQQALGTLEWISRSENLALAGPSGTGKSHFLEALGHQAIDAGLKVSWFTLETLTQTITRSKVDATTAKIVEKICRADLIVVDDIGMLPTGQPRPKPSTGSPTAPTSDAASRSPPTSTHPASTRSCPAPWPGLPSIGSSTMPMWC